MCSEHKDLVWEHCSSLYQLFTQSVLCLSLSSSHATDCWIGILLDSSLVFFLSPFHRFSTPSFPCTCQVCCMTPRKKKQREEREGETCRQTEAEGVQEDDTQRNSRLLSKNTMLSVSQLSVLICIHKPTCSHLRGMHVHRHKHT